MIPGSGGSDGVIVVGAGGHAAVCVDVMRSAGLTIAGVVAGGPPDAPLPVPWLGDDTWLERRLERSEGVVAFVAVGDNARRAALQAGLRSRGAAIVSVASPGAYIAADVELGEGSIVMPGAVINTRTVVGAGVIVNTGSSVDHDCRLGDFTHIAPGAHLAGTVTTGEGVFVGVGASVIPNVDIGSWTTVGAGAVVLDDLPAGITAVGVPARALASTPRAAQHVGQPASGPLGERRPG